MSDDVSWPLLRSRIWALHQQGLAPEQIAEQLGVSIGVVNRWTREAEMDQQQKLNAILEHLREPAAQNIHIFRNITSVQVAELMLPQVAQSLGYHLALLDGATIENKHDLLVALAQLYQFPDFRKNNYNTLSWDSVLDFMRDLMWITDASREDPIKGFLLAFLNPQPLFSSDAYTFATFLDILADASKIHHAEEMTFHIFIGSLEYPAELLCRMMKLHDQFCPVCEKSPLIDLPVPAR